MNLPQYVAEASGTKGSAKGCGESSGALSPTATTSEVTARKTPERRRSLKLYNNEILSGGYVGCATGGDAACGEGKEHRKTRYEGDEIAVPKGLN